MNYKKGDVVLLSDAGKVRRAKVVTDGIHKDDLSVYLS